MLAGRLNERVTIQQKSVVRDSDGSEAITWLDVATVWMQVQPLSGREFIAARQAQSDITTRFRCRYRAGLTTAMRLSWRGQAFAITDIIDRDAAGDELEILGYADTVAT